LANTIVSVFTQPSTLLISLAIGIVIPFFYTAQKIKEEGHVFFDSDSIEAKYFKSLFIVMNNISYILIPFGVFLFSYQKYPELGTLVAIYLFNNLIALNLLSYWVNITNDYEKLKNFKSSTALFKILINKRDVIASGIIFIILFFAFVLFFEMNFNLISLIYIEISLFIDYFIFCSVTYNIEGPLNIFFTDNQSNIANAYIFENSPHKDYLFIIMENNVKKKLMKSSIRSMEPS
jgi:hypothetical protein